MVRRLAITVASLVVLVACSNGGKSPLATGVLSGETEGTRWSLDYDAADDCVRLRAAAITGFPGCYSFPSSGSNARNFGLAKGAAGKPDDAVFWAVGWVGPNAATVELRRNKADSLQLPVVRLGDKRHGFFAVTYPAGADLVRAADTVVVYDSRGKVIGQGG